MTINLLNLSKNITFDRAEWFKINHFADPNQLGHKA